MSAFVMYMTVLRVRQGYSREQLAKMADTSSMSIGRIEDQGQEPKAQLLARLVTALKADWKDVRRFLLDKTLPAEEGRNAAYLRYAQIEAGLSDDEREPLTIAEALERVAQFKLADELREKADQADQRPPSKRSAK